MSSCQGILAVLKYLEALFSYYRNLKPINYQVSEYRRDPKNCPKLLNLALRINLLNSFSGDRVWKGQVRSVSGWWLYTKGPSPSVWVKRLAQGWLKRCFWNSFCDQLRPKTPSLNTGLERGRAEEAVISTPSPHSLYGKTSCSPEIRQLTKNMWHTAM